MLTKGTSGTKKSVTESWTGVAMWLALLLQGGSWTISSAIRAGDGEDQAKDAILCSWTLVNSLCKTMLNKAARN